MRAVQQQWFDKAIGLAMNPDKAYQLQCVDVVDHYAEAIFPKVPWTASVGGVNGAKDLPNVAPATYWTWVPNNPKNPGQLPQPGDVVVWGGTPLNPYGHTGVCVRADAGGVQVIQQNYNGLANLGAESRHMPYYGPGTGMITGWLRPRPERMPADPPAPKPATTPPLRMLTVTAPVAVVRTSPFIRPDNIARAYPSGIRKGAKIAALGYVAGQDPYPADKSTDNAWIKTKSGYYIWANAVGNSLAGLKKLA